MTTPGFEQLVPGVRVEGPLFPEPVEIIAVIPMGASVKAFAKGLVTKKVHEPILDLGQLAKLNTLERK